ncbi:MAG: hypothetical protein KJN67_01000, partial [Pontiella sp.]|nr:hypothetical protein [Pontiella sp.]
SRFYTELQDLTQDSETRNLLNTLIAHENVLEGRLKEYEDGVSSNILDTFFKYMVDGTDSYFSAYEVPDQVDSKYVIEAARYFDDCLSGYYREMARKALSERVREVLFNLMNMEMREQMSLSKRVLELNSSYYAHG